ncbi:MAG: GNAT family N-acetyltransferase [Sneathiellales bacterium]|nr:GNAT family N-acetyltransferase [Sneathiellales bacterium]
MLYTIRRATEKDVPFLADIEMDAGEILREHGLDAVADMPVAPHGYFEDFQAPNSIFVAADDRDQPVGFALLMVKDNQAHLKELSVHRDHMKQGLGKKLIEAVENQSVEQGFQKITLTTYSDLSFNAPFYERLGFDVFDPDKSWPEITAIRQDEKTRGLDIKPRVAMMKNLV